MQDANITKLFKSKKAVNDVSIIAIITFIFVGLGTILPFVNSEFPSDLDTFDTQNVADELIEEQFSDVSSVGAGDIIKSVGKMFFWTFGDLPFWLDAIFLVIRILLLFILIRNFTPFIAGGG